MRKTIVVALATALVVSLGTYALADHFSDVPNDHPFHDEIASMAAAGITTGFGDGTFRPGEDITRQAMAAFLERGNGRLFFDSRIGDPVTTITAPDTGVPMITVILAGAAGSGGGYALSTANMVMTGGTGCPCAIIIQMLDFSANVIGETFAFIDNGESQNITLQGADNLPADTGDIYFVRLFHFGPPGDEVTVRGEMSTIYVPFDFDAGNDTVIPSSDVEEGASELGFDLSELPDTVTQEDLDRAAEIVPDNLEPKD